MANLKAPMRQAGFTLIELILVMAIGSALAVMVFAGQRGLRSRAQFDAGVNRIIATVADARNQAAAGVNVVGTGDGTAGCAGGGGEYVFAGTAWSVDSRVGTTAVFQLDYYKAQVNSSGNFTGVACVFNTQTISFPSPMQANMTLPLAQRGGRVLFVRTATNGQLKACQLTNLTTAVAPVFGGGACTTPAPLVLNLQDADGHVSRVNIEASGLARRIN